MSIASRIEAIEQHLTDDYNVLEVAGADLTNVDKNILNLKPTWKERLLYFINNGTDVVWENWDKVTGEGTSLTLNKTLEAKMGIELKGNTYQDSTTGKNLYNDNFDDYTQPTNYRICPITLTQGQAYVLKGNKIGTTITGAVVAVVPYGEQYTDFSTQLKMAVDSGGNGHTLTFTPDSTWTSPKLAIYASDKTIFDNLFTNYEIQLEKGSAATSYEPYTNGASPNPDYPQDIHVVSGDNTIKVVGKNLLPTTLYHLALNASGDTAGLIVGNANRNAYYCKIEPNTTYYISRGSVGTATYWYYAFTDVEPTGGVQSLSFANMSSDLSTQVTSPNNAKYICVFMGGGLSNNVMVSSSSDTTYEPYQSQSYNVNLGSIELCKIGDYQDSIVKDNGKWYLNKQIGKVVLNGSENWATTSYSRFYCDSLFAGIKSENDSISNYFVRGNTETTNNVFGISPAGRIYIRNDEQTTLSNFKTWLSTHNTTVYYVLATPTYTEITDSTLLSQLNALAKSYASQTNISQESNDLASILNATALREMA